MSVDVQGIESTTANLQAYAKTVSNRKERQNVLYAGGQKVAQAAAKSPTPKSRKAHYYYAKTGPIEIKPGNLRRSMRPYKNKEGDIEIGPKVLRRVVGMPVIGATKKTASGFYAAALYGSAAAFRRAVMEPALTRSQAAALTAMQKRYERLHQKLTR